MRPAPSRETTKPSSLKPEKDNKRKRVSEPENPQDKKSSTRRLRKRFAQMGTDSAHDSPDGEENDGEEPALVTRTGRSVEAIKTSELESPPCGEDARKEETGKAPVSPEVEIVPPSSTTIPKGVNAEAPEVNENAPSEELGAATTSHSLSLPTYFGEAIEEANTLHMPDPSKAVAKFKAELKQCEVELKRVSGEEKALRILCSQKEEELKDLQTSLAKAQKSESELDEQLQQKLDMIGQLRGEVNQVRADYHQWKENMDRLNAEKEVVKAQLTSEIEELGAELAKAYSEAAYAKAEAAQAKAEAEKTKVMADKSIAIYQKEAAAIQAELKAASNRAKSSSELAKCQARRETLEEVRARGFDLAEEIAEAQARETHARFLVSYDDEDVVSGSEDGESEENAPEGEEAREDKAIGDEDVTPGDEAPKID
ncbi:PREDICTED: myosin-14-like [Nicotiana attenuata]|uniref:myosin-14-like n=1 Tax=Nicotiana attenuata TaxID=49451 RepID=UPI000904C6FD|nr:PREDICTED: myosin-14-like [Nicotiana attenuata]